MSARKRGTIINVSSIGDRKPGPSGETYHASKAAVRSLTESLQQAEAKNNVRIINIAPGFVKTKHPRRNGHLVRRALPLDRKSGFHRPRTNRRDYPVLLQAAAGDLHPRPGGHADDVGLLMERCAINSQHPHLSAPLIMACVTGNDWKR